MPDSPRRSSPSRFGRSNTSPARNIESDLRNESPFLTWRSDRRLDTDITYRNVSPEIRNGEVSPIASTSGAFPRNLSPLRAIRGRNSLRLETTAFEDKDKNPVLTPSVRWSSFVKNVAVIVLLSAGLFFVLRSRRGFDDFLNSKKPSVRSLVSQRVAEMVQNKLLVNEDAASKEFWPVKDLPDGKRLRILVTGGAGFVGSHLVDALMLQGHRVIVLDNLCTGVRDNIQHWVGHPNFQFLLHDVADPIHMEVDRIYHLAGPPSPLQCQINPIRTIKTGIFGTKYMLGLAKRVRARMLLASAAQVYGELPVSPQQESSWGNVDPIGSRACFDESKRVAETMMYAYQAQASSAVRVARIFDTYGPRLRLDDGRIITNMILQALQGEDILIYGNGSHRRSFQFVDDLVDGLLALMEGDYDNPVNLGNPHDISMEDLAQLIKSLTESKSAIRYVQGNFNDGMQRCPNISVAKRELGWRPQVSLMQGLSSTIRYFKEELQKYDEKIRLHSEMIPSTGALGLLRKIVQTETLDDLMHH